MRDDLEALVDGGAAPRPLHEPHHAAAFRCPRERLARLRAGWASTTSRSPSRTWLAAASDGSPACARFERKLEVARWVKELGLPAHAQHRPAPRQPRPRRGDHRARRAPAGADRLELANTQYLGWALAQPRRPAAHARAAASARAVAAGGTRAPHAAAWRFCSSPGLLRRSSKACMDGWGRRFMVGEPRTASSCPVTPLTRFRADLRPRDGASARGHLGGRRPASPPSAARTWMPEPLPELRAPRASTSAAVAVRHSISPATPPPPTPRVGSRLTTALIEAARAAAARRGPAVLLYRAAQRRVRSPHP